MTKFCTSCGHHRPEADKFCGECGHRFPLPSPSSSAFFPLEISSNSALHSSGSTPPDSPTGSSAALPQAFDSMSSYASDMSVRSQWTPSCGTRDCSLAGVHVCKKCKKRLCADHALVHSNKRPICLACAKRTLGYYLPGSPSSKSSRHSEPSSPSTSPPLVRKGESKKTPLIRSQSLMNGHEMLQSEKKKNGFEHNHHHLQGAQQEIVLNGNVATIRIVVPNSTVVIVREKEQMEE